MSSIAMTDSSTPPQHSTAKSLAPSALSETHDKRSIVTLNIDASTELTEQNRAPALSSPQHIWTFRCRKELLAPAAGIQRREQTILEHSWARVIADLIVWSRAGLDLVSFREMTKKARIVIADHVAMEAIHRVANIIASKPNYRPLHDTAVANLLGVTLEQKKRSSCTLLAPAGYRLLRQPSPGNFEFAGTRQSSRPLSRCRRRFDRPAARRNACHRCQCGTCRSAQPGRGRAF
jgi:hypothetical protein